MVFNKTGQQNQGGQDTRKVNNTKEVNNTMVVNNTIIVNNTNELVYNTKMFGDTKEVKFCISYVLYNLEPLEPY